MTSMDNQRAELEKFVGRKAELAKFEKILSAPLGKKRTLYIQASGGQGKTWLIKKMLLMAADKPNITALDPDDLIDMYSTSNRHIEGTIAVLKEMLVKKIGDTGIFNTYDDAHTDLERARAQEEYSTDEISHKVKELRAIFRKCLEDITRNRTIVLALDTFENVSDSEVRVWAFSDDGLQMPNLVCLVGSRSPWTSDDKARYSSIELMELGGLSDEDALDLYLSFTKEAKDDISDERRMLIRSLNEKSKNNPLLLGLSIIYLDLANNSLEAAQALTQSEFEQQVVSWLSIRTGPQGSVYIGGVEYSEQMRQTLALMSYLNRRFDRYFLDKLCVNNYIQMEDVTVNNLWAEVQRRKPELFFVKKRQGDVIQLHDILAELLRKYVFIDVFSDVTGERLREFIADVEDWYDERITIEYADQDMKSALYAEQLAYLLRSDLIADCLGAKGQIPEICERLKYLAPVSGKIVATLEKHKRQRSDILAGLVIGEAKPHLVERFGGENRYEIYRLLGAIAEQCYKHTAAREYFKMAYQEAIRLGDETRRVEALLDEHNSTFQDAPMRSLELLDQAEKICRSGKAKKLLPKVLYEKGFTHRLLNNLTESAKWYAKALFEASRLKDKHMMPIILNDEGYNFLLLGQLIKARISIRAARDQRHREYTRLKKQLHNTKLSPEQKEALEEDVRDAAKMLGLSYSTLGDLARFSRRLDEALTRYKEAMAHFQYCKSRYWQTKMHFTIGETYRRIAMADYTAGRTQKYRRMDKLAEENIQQSIALCKQYGFRNDLVTAYRRLGRLHHDRMFRAPKLTAQLEHLDRARHYFQDSLAIARDTKNQLEILENLTELAFLGDDYLSITQDKDEARYELEKENAEKALDEFARYLESCPEDERVHQFPVFQHLLEIEQAAHHFVLGDKESALRLYQVGYAGMASLPGYGVARYLQHLDHLMKQLKKLFREDEELGRVWCKSFLEHWKSKRLMKRRPELPQEVATIMETYFLLE